jgi:ATP-dependent exoDNAse (exonuclease V) beta subunit
VFSQSERGQTFLRPSKEKKKGFNREEEEEEEEEEKTEDSLSIVTVYKSK